MGAHTTFSALSHRGLNHIKLAYSISWPNGQLLTAGTFNLLCNYVGSPGIRAYCYTEHAVSSLAVAVASTSIHFAYQQKDGQAELARVSWSNTKMVYMRTVTHLSTNVPQHRITSLMQPMVLPLG